MALTRAGAIVVLVLCAFLPSLDDDDDNPA